MKIFMAGAPNDGVGAWRMHNAAEVMRQGNHEIVTMPLMKEMGPEQIVGHYGKVLTEFEPDVVWCGKVDRTTVSLFRRCKEFGVRARVFDVDDLIHDLPDDNPAAKAVHSQQMGYKKVWDAILGVSDAITCTTDFLVDYYGDWKDGLGPKAFKCPNVMEPGLIAPDKYPKVEDKRLRVGFIYNTNRHGDFLPLITMLRELIDAGTIHLTLLGSFPEEFWGVSPKSVRWVRHAPPKRFWNSLAWAGLDVVLSRLKPHNFNKAKSNIKWIEASLAGAVTMTTQWGEMTDLAGAVALAHDAPPEDWGTALEALAADKTNGTLGERVKVAQAAVEADWMTTSPSAIALWQKVLDHVESNHWDRDDDSGGRPDIVPHDEGASS